MLQTFDILQRAQLFREWKVEDRKFYASRIFSKIENFI